MLTAVVHSFLADNLDHTDSKSPLAKYYDPDLIRDGVVVEVPGRLTNSPTTFWILFKESLPLDLKVGDMLEIIFSKKEAS